MRILIDFQGAQTGSRHRGIGRYSTALAKAIIRNRGEHEVFILLNGLFEETLDQIRNGFAALVPQDHIVTFAAPSPVEGFGPENAWRQDAAELIREWTINTIAPDVVLITSLFEGAIDSGITSIGRLDASAKVAVVLYDLIPFLDPEPYLLTQEAMSWYHAKIDWLRRADLLLPISDSARNEAIDVLGFDPERAVAIYAAADERFAPANLPSEEGRGLLERLGIRRNFVMHTSAFEPRKNFEGLIRAFGLLPLPIRQQHQLVLVAAIPLEGQIKLRQIADAAGLQQDELVFAGHVTDQQLIALYSLCSLFVFPSFHEGFGLPPLEAMRCGAAVIGSNTTSIPEVIGREDALFDPNSDHAIAALMERALSDRLFWASLKDHGARHSQSFSWDRSAELALRALEKIAAGSSVAPGGAETSLLLQRIGEIDTPCSPSKEDLVAVAQSIAANERVLERFALARKAGVRPDHAGSDRQDPVVSAADRDSSSLAARAVEVISRDVWFPDERPRILLLKLDHIGDFIIALDAFRLLRDTWPNAHLTLVCGSWNRTTAEEVRLFDTILCCDFYPDSSAAYYKEAVVKEGIEKYCALELGVYDLAVDLRYYDDNRILLLHTDAKYRAGYVADGVPLDLALPTGPETTIAHIGARTMALAAAVAWTFGAPAGRSREGLLRKRTPDRLFERGIIVGIAPGTGNPIKSWGRDRFAELARRLQARGDYRFVLIGGRRDRADAEYIGRVLAPADFVDLAGSLAVTELPPVIAGLDVFIGNDTSTTHMAALMGVPTLCIFSGPVFLESWRPIGPHVVTLKAPVECSPCNLSNIDDCTKDHQCMNIPPSCVAAEVVTLLEQVSTKNLRCVA